MDRNGSEITFPWVDSFSILFCPYTKKSTYKLHCSTESISPLRTRLIFKNFNVTIAPLWSILEYWLFFSSRQSILVVLKRKYLFVSRVHGIGLPVAWWMCTYLQSSPWLLHPSENSLAGPLVQYTWALKQVGLFYFIYSAPGHLKWQGALGN